ncbi:hypothetical protein V1514DRAFT_344724 [Lipomyces japonicus]|uniref:uncharacterized protein n=1 Tax=Lipomyces japonicus TaxID=56871 RepID=UPI0034D00BEC
MQFNLHAGLLPSATLETPMTIFGSLIRSSKRTKSETGAIDLNLTKQIHTIVDRYLSDFKMSQKSMSADIGRLRKTAFEAESKSSTIPDLVGRLTDLSQQLTTLTEAHQTLQTSYTDLERKYNALSISNTDLLAKLNDLQSPTGSVTALAHTEATHHKDHERQIKTLASTQDTLVKKVEHVKSAIVSTVALSNKIEAYHNDFQTKHTEYDAAAKQNRFLTTSQFNALQTSIHNKVAAVTTATATLTEQVNGISITVNTQKHLNTSLKRQVEVAKGEVRAAHSKVDTSVPWSVVARSRAPPVASKIQKAAKAGTVKAMEGKYPVYIRRHDTSAPLDHKAIASAIDRRHGLGTVSFVTTTTTTTGHITAYITKKDLVVTAQKWLPEAHPNFALLETTPWYKGVIHNVPAHVTMMISGGIIIDYQHHRMAQFNPVRPKTRSSKPSKCSAHATDSSPSADLAQTSASSSPASSSSSASSSSASSSVSSAAALLSSAAAALSADSTDATDSSTPASSATANTTAHLTGPTQAHDN